MRKIRNYFVLMMVALVSAVSFTACNGDDDDDPEAPVSNSKIVGTWKCVNVKFICKENGKIVEQYDEPNDELLIWEFTSSGKIVVTESHDVNQVRTNCQAISCLVPVIMVKLTSITLRNLTVRLLKLNSHM